MFETIRKARQLGAIALERVGEYLELLKDIGRDSGAEFDEARRSGCVVALFAVLSLIFLGLAVIVTCWDTPYRVHLCMGRCGLLCLDSLVAYISATSRADLFQLWIPA